MNFAQNPAYYCHLAAEAKIKKLIKDLFGFRCCLNNYTKVRSQGVTVLNT